MNNIVLTAVSLPDGKELERFDCRTSKVPVIKLLWAQQMLHILQRQFQARVGKVMIVWEMPSGTTHQFWLSDKGVWLTDEDMAFDECEAYRNLVIATKDLRTIFAKS